MTYKQSYAQKLKSPQWQKMRLRVLEADGWTCQRCGDTESTLHVHHKAYLRDREPWDYPICALVTLCEECHEFESGEGKRRIEALVFVLRCLFDGDASGEFLEAYHTATLLVSDSEQIKSALIDGLRSLVGTCDDHGRKSGRDLQGVPEESCEGQGTGGDCESTEEGGVRGTC